MSETTPDATRQAEAAAPGAQRAAAPVAHGAADTAEQAQRQKTNSRAPRVAEHELLARARRTSDGAAAPVLPDCCNWGTILRLAIAFNAGIALFALAVGVAQADVIGRFVDLAIVVEPALAGSLAALCVVRRWVNGQRRRVQWMAGIGLPALIAALSYAASARAPGAGEVAVTLLAAGTLAWLAIEFLRLRSLSLSPSLSEARLQALQARIRPHFLFNSLNTVLGMMRSDPRGAERTLEDLSDLFRVFMRDTRELIPLDEEVATCQQYLAIEQLRIGERLRVSWHVDEMPRDALLPSLLLQPLLENAVHHGIEPSPEPGEVRIEITRPGERVRVEVVNPALAAAPSRSGNHMALANVKERLSLLYDMEASLETSVEQGLFRLLLEFPYRKERRRRDDRRHFNPHR
jgi:two-component system sensor histidine kinase AlgZ